MRDVECDIVVNLQADEPQIVPRYIDKVANLLAETEWADMATLVAGFDRKKQVEDANIVKALLDRKGKAIYFSRSVVPYDRGAEGAGKVSEYLRHLGIYAYRKDFLLKFTELEQSFLERTEKLEQLRAIENGYSIVAAKVEHAWDGIDTAEQYAAFVKRYQENNK